MQKNIVCKNIDISKLADLELVMKEVVIAQTNLKVYRDLHYPNDTTSKVGNYPHQLLMGAEVPIKIDKITLSNANIYYRENSKVGDSIGVVAFEKAKIIVNNASNISKANGQVCTVNFNALFIGSIPLSGKFTFYLDKWKEGNFRIETSATKSFDAKALNQLTIPMALARIDNGIFNSVTADIQANNYNSTGTVTLTYEKLKISLLKRKEDALNRKTLFSFLANLLVKNNNRRADQRIAKVEYERDTTKGFFNFIWKSIFAGGKDILGVKL